MKRRDLIKAGVMAGAAAALSAQAQSALSNQPGILARARNLIFFAYDGMGWEDYAIAQFYSRRVLGKPLALERFLATGVSGLQNTNSLTSFVTESSAAGNAWSTGVKTVNGGLAIHADGRKLTPIFALAKQQGKAVGLVSTATITHATPASFVVSNPDRNAEEQIAEQYLDFGAEVYLGGGTRFFDPAVRRDKKDMYAAFAAKGYGVVKNPRELEASNASKLLGVFSSSHVPYEADRRFQGVDVPSLAQMTRAALPRLAAHSKGFVLQVEAARIDHANHLNDPAGTLWDILAADEAPGSGDDLRRPEPRHPAHPRFRPRLRGSRAIWYGALVPGGQRGCAAACQPEGHLRVYAGPPGQQPQPRAGGGALPHGEGRGPQA
jgi:alkaline phosphatase